MLPSRALEATGLAGMQSLARHTGVPGGGLSLLDVAAHTEELAAALCSHTVGVDVLGSLSTGHGVQMGDTAAEKQARVVLAALLAYAAPVLCGSCEDNCSSGAVARTGQAKTLAPERLWCCRACTGKVLSV
jgi:hypothetical protein